MIFGNSKKGFNFLMVLQIIVVIAVIAIVSVMSTNIFGDFNNEVQSDDDFSEVAKNSSDNFDKQVPGSLDWIGVFMFAGVVIFFIMSAYFSTTNYFFLGVAVLLMILLSIYPMILSNIWDEFTLSDGLGDEVQEYPMTGWLLDNYGVVWIFMFITGIITGVVGNVREGRGF